MDALSILALATQCVTAAPAPVVAAIAIAETNGSVYSVLIKGERSAIASVPTKELDKRSIPYSDGFSACSNMAIAGDMLREFWSDDKDQNWRRAVLEVAPGDRDVEGVVAKKFDGALTDVRKAAKVLPRPTSAIETGSS